LKEKINFWFCKMWFEPIFFRFFGSFGRTRRAPRASRRLRGLVFVPSLSRGEKCCARP